LTPGEVELKEKYKELKDLQKNMNVGEELFERKKQMLVEKIEPSKRMDEAQADFDEKAKIEKISLLEQVPGGEEGHQGY
jgi:hypothetical protein